MHIIYLKPRAPYRSDFRSDTLWGLICWSIRMVYGNDFLEEILGEYLAGRPKFLISSSFPFIEQNEEGKKTPFIPVPLLPPAATDGTDGRKAQIQQLKERKEIKKVKLIPLSDLQEFQEGLSSLTLYQKLTTLSTNNTIPKVSSESITHNRISRITGATLKIGADSGQLFHQEDKFVFVKDFQAGLYFFYEGDLAILNASLRYLRHRGWGGDAATGRGDFDFIIDEIHDFPVPDPKKHNAVMNLSLYRPTREEIMFFKHASSFGEQMFPFYYQIEPRKGIMGMQSSRWDKKTVTMLKEGSVMPFQKANPFWGELVDVTPPGKVGEGSHSVFQYAYGFMAGLKINY